MHKKTTLISKSKNQLQLQKRCNTIQQFDFNNIIFQFISYQLPKQRYDLSQETHSATFFTRHPIHRTAMSTPTRSRECKKDFPRPMCTYIRAIGRGSLTLWSGDFSPYLPTQLPSDSNQGRLSTHQTDSWVTSWSHYCVLENLGSRLLFAPINISWSSSPLLCGVWETGLLQSLVCWWTCKQKYWWGWCGEVSVIWVFWGWKNSFKVWVVFGEKLVGRNSC